MTDEYTIEYANPGLGDWEEHFGRENLIRLRGADKWPLGKVVLSKGTNEDCGPFEFRIVPRDPLLKAMVLAQVEGKC